jgi:SAM-dependent methyltransferase
MGEPKSLGDLLQETIESMRARGIEDPVCYDLGCGYDRMPGFTGLDYYANDPNILKTDLFALKWEVDGKPLPGESADLLYSSHFVEHVPYWNGFFEEAYRIMKPGAYFVIVTPYLTSNRAFQDPDHKQFISEERYQYLNKEWRDVNNLSHYSAAVNFVVEGFLYDWHRDFKYVNEEAQEYAKLHYKNVVNDIVAILRKEPL